MTAFPVLTAKQRTEEIKARAVKSKKSLRDDKAKAQERLNWARCRKDVYNFITHPMFEAVCGVIILFNMVLVIFETDAASDDGDPAMWVQVMTNVLLGVYTVELVAKLFVFRVDFFRDMWNVMDFFIVGVDLVFLFLSLVLDSLPSFSVLRVFRLVRLARAFKAAKSLHELHSLLRACACALKAIFWGMVLMGLTLTVWGILAVQLIHPINKRLAEANVYKDCDRCPRAFATVFDSVLTIWKQIVAGDSWGQLCEPIVEEEGWTFIFFVLVLVTVALTMLNCILAVVVEAGAAAAAADEHDKALQQEKMVMESENKLVGLCAELDQDNSGTVSIQEFLKGFKNNEEFRQCLEVMHVTEDDMFMIFNICDEDDSGDVDYTEFVDQLRRIKHSGEQMTLHYVTDIRHVCSKIGHHLGITNLSEQDRGNVRQDPDVANPDGGFAVDAGKPTEAKLIEGSQVEELLSPKGEPTSALVEVDLANSAAALARETSKSNDAATEMLIQERLERIYKINEDVILIMSDVAQQSKVQTILMRTLADGIGTHDSPDQASRVSSSRANPKPMGSPSALRPESSASANARLSARKDGSEGAVVAVDALITTGVDRSAGSACCARLVEP